MCLLKIVISFAFRIAIDIPCDNKKNGTELGKLHKTSDEKNKQFGRE
jgi:hypothetical protein